MVQTMNYPDGTALALEEMPFDFEYTGISGDGTTPIYISQSTGKMYTDDPATGGYIVLGNVPQLGTIVKGFGLPVWFWAALGIGAIMLLSKGKRK